MGWSRHHLWDAFLRGPVWINDVIYAELSVRYAHIGDLDAALSGTGLDRRPMPAAALFLAGKVFRKYRQNGGSRVSLLPDLFIGAQAQIEGFDLLTRDPKRYRTYFPRVSLITPYVS